MTHIIKQIIKTFDNFNPDELKSPNLMFKLYEHPDILKHFNLSYLGMGGSRIAFQFHSYVIKIGNAYQNQEEYYNYLKINSNPVLKYSTIPIFKIIPYNKYNSFIISAKANKIKSNKTETDFIAQHYKNQKQVLSDFYTDAHVRNIMKFAHAGVLIDLNMPNYIKPHSKACQWKSLINFDKHKKSYDNLYNSLLTSLHDVI